LKQELEAIAVSAGLAASESEDAVTPADLTLGHDEALQLGSATGADEGMAR
jgi:hypothetical protein